LLARAGVPGAAAPAFATSDHAEHPDRRDDVDGLALTDLDGFELTDSREGLAVDGPCAPGDAAGVPCCGPGCARIRRYDRCPVPPDDAPCAAPGPPRIWVCEDLRCDWRTQGGLGPDSALNGQPPPVIRYLGIGYRRTDTVIDVDGGGRPESEPLWSLADAGVVGPNGEIFRWCYDDCTHPDLAQRGCSLWEEAVLCSGQTYRGVLPRVFVLVATGRPGDAPYFGAGDCGTTTATPIGMPQDPTLCFEFRVGRAPWRGALPAGGVQGLFTAPGRQCCDCVPGCSSTTADVPDALDPNRVRRLRCCCSPEGTFSEEWYYTIERVYVDTAPQPTPPGPERWSGRGSAVTAYGPDGQIVRTRGERSETYDFFYFDGSTWAPVHEGQTGAMNASTVCIDSSLDAGIPAPFGPFGHRWTLPSGAEREANFQMPAALEGMRESVWEGGGEREEMVIRGAGAIIRCGLAAKSWGGDAKYYRDGRLLYTTRFRGSRTVGGRAGVGGVERGDERRGRWWRDHGRALAGEGVAAGAVADPDGASGERCGHRGHAGARGGAAGRGGLQGVVSGDLRAGLRVCGSADVVECKVSIFSAMMMHRTAGAPPPAPPQSLQGQANQRLARRASRRLWQPSRPTPWAKAKAPPA